MRKLSEASGVLALALLVFGCAPDQPSPVGPPSSVESNTPEVARFEASGERAPPRELDDAQTWAARTTTQLWDQVARHDSTIVVGMKAPGANRGVWRGEMLLDAQELRSARSAVLDVEGVRLLGESEHLPAVQLQVRSQEALEELRAMQQVDYIDPGVMELLGFMSSGCSYPANSPWGHGATPSGDSIPHRFSLPGGIDFAWNRTDGSGVVVGVVDTGVSSLQDQMTSAFSSGLSSGRHAERRSVLPAIGGYPSWHGECSHGNRMASVILAPMDGSGIVGAAWKSDMVSVRFADGVIMPQTINTADALFLAATEDPANTGWNPRRIVTMAWGTASSYAHVSDMIDLIYAPPYEALLIGASGTSMWGVSSIGVVWPARKAEVVAVSAVSTAMGSMSHIHYGPQVELAYLEGISTMGRWSNTYSTLDGSSAATAVVSGIAALVWSYYPTASRDWIRQRLQLSAHNHPVRNSTSGYGVPNAMKAVGGMWMSNIDGPEVIATGVLNQYSAIHAGGDGPFTYSWSTGASTQAIMWTGSSEGAHEIHVTITDLSDGTQRTVGKSIFVWDDPGDCPPCIIPPG